MTGRSWRIRLRHETQDAVGLVIICATCGRPIVLTADANGIVVPNRDEFITTHGACLATTGLPSSPEA